MLENLERAGTPPKVRLLISREMRAEIAKRDRSGGGPQGDAQAGQEAGRMGSLWRVSGRGG